MLVDTVIDVLGKYQLPYGAATMLMDAVSAEVFGTVSSPAPYQPDTELLADDEPEYVADVYDAEGEYAASVAGCFRPDPLDEYDPPYVYGLR